MSESNLCVAAERYPRRERRHDESPADEHGREDDDVDAFAAAQALVDEVKARLPVWKKQIHADGTHSWSGLENAR